MNNKLWPRLIQWVLVLALPIVLLTANIRVATGHWFVHWEYGKANFPPDPYGLSTKERIDLAEVCVDYIASSADISLLGDLKLDNGDPAFNARELRHMFDVQVVYSRIMTVGIVAALILLGAIITSLATRYPRQRVATVLWNGSLFTLGLLGIVGGYMALNWRNFFTTFHRIFFEGDTWTFPLSDTLIRLFPMKLWIDVAIVIVAPLVIESIIIAVASQAWIQRLDNKSVD
ncbi:MAG: TIGR01906 family membrane protein [Chloroflexi bacterium]|nr:TIGR01906 family membrane protein [Chloroflexota bacterium]